MNTRVHENKVTFIDFFPSINKFCTSVHLSNIQNMKNLVKMNHLSFLVLFLTPHHISHAFTIPKPHPTTSHSHSHSTQLHTSSSSNDISNLNLTPQLQSITTAFSSIPDEKLRYKQLLYMANQLPPMDPKLMTPENKVPGCLSTVYVDCTTSTNSDDGKIVLNYVGSSDGLLTKGLVALLVRGLSGCTPEEIENVSPEFINKAGITQSLTPGRNNGFLNMLAVMKKKAKDVQSSISSGNQSDNGSMEEEMNDDDITSPNGEIITSFTPIEGKPMYNEIYQSLLKLKPTQIDLIDESHQHAGHAGSKGWEESGESHFNLYIVSDVFSGMALVKRHQLIYLLLGETMNKIHALKISAKASDEV